MENAAINIILCLNSNSPETALGSIAIAGLYTARMTLCLQVLLPLSGPKHTCRARRQRKSSLQTHPAFTSTWAHQMAFEWHIVVSGYGWREKGQVLVPPKHTVSPSTSLPHQAALILSMPRKLELSILFQGHS